MSYFSIGNCPATNVSPVWWLRIYTNQYWYTVSRDMSRIDVSEAAATKTHKYVRPGISQYATGHSTISIHLQLQAAFVV